MARLHNVLYLFSNIAYSRAMQQRRPKDAIKGRGAPLNDVSARFNLPQREADGDWLDALPDQRLSRL